MYVQPSKPNTKLTSYVESYVKDFRNHVRTFYSREDFFRKLSEIKNCKRKDEEFSLKRELRDMLRARGLDMKKFLINGDNLDIESLKKALQVIPLQKELKLIFIKKLYEIFEAFPTPEDFMFRLIRHFTKDEFSNDSLRMQILKMFIRNTNYHTDALINRVVENFSSAERNSYEVLDSFNKRERIISCLTEDIFSDDINFTAWLDFVCRWFDKRKLNDCKPPAEFSFSKIVTFTLRKLLNSSDSHDLSGIKLLKSLQEGFITDRSFSVNKLTSRANREIVKYLKQFRHESQKSFGHIFNRALKDSTKFSTDMTLPNLAQDLAESIMKAHGVTKFQLYLLAFALNLNRDEFIKMLSDIYQDNFLRHINDSQQKTTRRRKNDTASFLCGESINYKNYVETILLYFLCKSTSRDRLDRALKMIEHCFYVVRKKAKALNTDCKISSVLSNTNKLTKYYVDEFENILSFSEKEFEKYIVSNFHIYEPLAPLSNSRIMMNAENNTARKYFLKLADVAETLMDAEYGVDIEWLISELRESDDREVQKILADERFLKVLRKLDDTLHIERRDLLDSELLKSRKFFTRTDLIALYYFVFVNTVLNDAIDSYQITDVETLYDDFVYGNLMQDQGLDFSLHESLSECKFHSLSVTSIYDQFILFYLYLKVIF